MAHGALQGDLFGMLAFAENARQGRAA